MRTLYRTPEFDEFYETLDERVKTKFKYTFEVIKSVYALPVKYVKRLEGTELYEMRVSVGYNEYRTVLFAVDNENIILSTKIMNALLCAKVQQELKRKHEKDEYRKRVR